MSTTIVGSAFARGANITSITITRNGVTAGNALLVSTAYYGATPTISSTPSETWGSPVITRQQSQTVLRLWRVASAAGGNYSITVQGDGSDWAAGSVVEVSNMPTDAVDVTATNGGQSNAPTTGTTSAPSNATTISFAMVGVEGTTSAWTDAGIDQPSGFTNIALEQNAWDYIGFSFDYRINTSASAQSASYGTLIGTTHWAGGIAVFRATVTASGGIGVRAGNLAVVTQAGRAVTT